MFTFLFRSRELILESDEADLIRDVCLDIDKAQKKLKTIRDRLQVVGRRDRVSRCHGNQTGRGDRCRPALGAKMKRRRRSIRKRNWQRLAAAARRLKR